MPNMDLPTQSMYSPLSQNMTSDSESEEEIHSSSIASTNHIIKGNGPSMGSSRKMSINTHILGSMHEINCNNYSNINSDGDDSHHYHHTHTDNVAILNRSAYKLKTNKPMSTLRKCCFVASILVCVLTVVLFLWVIPCSNDSTCPAKSERIRTQNWMRNYERIELKGGINVVDGIHGRSKNLLFMYRGDKLWSEVEMVANRKPNGIISLIGSSGAVGWFDEIANEPSIIDCTLIDANHNGSPDCLILDEYGELSCIDPQKGLWIWHIVDRTFNRKELLSFPLILPDLNKDGVNELLVTSTNTQQNLYNTLNIVSGATGQALGTRYTIRECSYIHKFQLDTKYKVSFNCINNDTEIQIVKPLDDLYRLITNKSVNLGLEVPYPALNQHKFYGQRKDTIMQRNIYSVSGKQLIVENNGKCPESCNVTVQLIEQKNGKEHVIRNFNGSRMYGMVPALLSFNSTGSSSSNGKSSVHGFVIKFWEWSINETDIQYQTRHKRSTAGDGEFNRFAHVLKQKSAWRLPTSHNDLRYKRSTSDQQQQQQQNTSKESIFKSKMRLIKETVVLIVFNSTDTRIENTSQSNIIQFCRTEGTEVSCQPDLNYQENSVLIADLDQDGSQELVTYYTTFVNTGDDSKMEWKLITYVQLLRLEAELPKLYIVDDKY